MIITVLGCLFDFSSSSFLRCSFDFVHVHADISNTSTVFYFISKNFKVSSLHSVLKWGLSNTPNPKQAAKLVTVCDRSQWPITLCQFTTWWQSSVVLHTYTNVCGDTVLEWGIFVTLLLPVYLCCLQIVMISHQPSPLLATSYRSGVLDMYVWDAPKHCLSWLILLSDWFQIQNKKTNTKQNMQLDLENTHHKALRAYKKLHNIESSFIYLDLN